MKLTYVLLVMPLITCASAFPDLSEVRSPPIFSELTYATLPYNFTLAALNVSLSNANTTGVPLVLGQNGAVDGAEFEVTSTYASFPYDDYPTIGLVSNTLRAYRASGGLITNATSISDSNAQLSWFTSGLYSSPAAAQYAAVLESGDEFAQLAVVGRKDLWSLCPFGDQPLSQRNLVFNVTGETGRGFVPSECWRVTVNIVGV